MSEKTIVMLIAAVTGALFGWALAGGGGALFGAVLLGYWVETKVYPR